MFHPRSLYKN